MAAGVPPHYRRMSVLRKHTADGGSLVSRSTVAAAPQTAPHPLGLTEIERYWFETQGWVVIPGVLSAEQVQACNDALENNRNLVKYTPLSKDGRDWVVPPPL